jgi:hypothetical protein
MLWPAPELLFSLSKGRLMKFAIFLFALSFVAQASPMMTTKERLRLHLWVHGIQERPVHQVKNPSKKLPEELERSLRKI